MVDVSKHETMPLRDGAIAREVFCPLCAQSLPVADFLHTPDYSILVRAAHVAWLSVHESIAFRLLFNSRATGLSHDDLTNKIYAGNGGPNNAKGSAYVTMQNLKRKLAPLRITIKSESRLYRTYFHA